MKTDLILKFKQNLFSKVIWSSTFKFLKIVIFAIPGGSDIYKVVYFSSWLEVDSKIM